MPFTSETGRLAAARRKRAGPLPLRCYRCIRCQTLLSQTEVRRHHCPMAAVSAPLTPDDGDAGSMGAGSTGFSSGEGTT